GPIAARILPRSSPSLPATKWSAPAPRSNPSRTTYAVSMSATIANQISIMRAPRDLAPDERQEEGAEHAVEPREADEREERGPRRHLGARGVRRAEQLVDDPRLPAELGGHPAGGVRDVGEGEREHERPEERPRGEETAAPEQER